jgi:DedD protein
MEKKKLLLVSVAVGLFLVVAIGASVLVFSPRDYHSVTRVDAVPVPSGISNSVPDVAAQTPLATLPQPPRIVAEQSAGSTAPAVTEAVNPSGNERNLENIIYITSGDAEDSVRVERLNDGSTTTYITIPAPSEKAAAVAAVPAQAVPALQAVAAVPAAMQEKPAVTATAVAAKPAAQAASRPASSESARSNPSWWVQTNSYSKKAYADNAKKFLETKGITSVVTNGTVGGKTYYRVRVGPYASQAEADYWLSLIKNIEGMENSLVWKGSSL